MFIKINNEKLASPPKKSKEDTFNEAVLNQPRDLFNVITQNDHTIILSADPAGFIWPAGDTSKGKYYIYCENLILQDTLKAKELTISASTLNIKAPDNKIIFDVSGKDGADAMKVNDIASAGDDGGTIALYLENSYLSDAYSINAQGGKGGNGYNNESNAKGGNGGNGGNGGQIKIFVSHPYRKCADDLNPLLERIVSDSTNIDKIKTNLIEKLTIWMNLKDVKLTQLLNLLKKETLNQNEIYETQKLSFETMKILIGLCDIWTLRQDNVNNVNGGEGGVYGSGTPHGQSGQEGSPGAKEVYVIGNIESAEPPMFLNLHPVQCAMTLNRAKLLYMFLDAIKSPEEVVNLRDLLINLVARLKPFSNLKTQDSTFLSFWQTNENIIATNDAAKTFNSLHNEAKGYLDYLSIGLDFYGYKSNYVPVISVHMIQEDGVKPLLESFKVIDQAYKNYFIELKNEDKTVNNLKQIQQNLYIQTKQLNVDILALEVQIPQKSAMIDSYEKLIPYAKDQVHNKLNNYYNKIAQYTDLDTDSLLKTLSSVAFAPESSLMWGVGLTQLFHDNAENITDIEGIPVRKEYIIHKLTKVGADLKSLSEDYKTHDDGTIDANDPNATILVAKEQELQTSLDKFYNLFPKDIDDLTIVLKNYVHLVTERNTQIIDYNSLLTLLKQKSETLNNINAQSADASQKMLTQSSYNNLDSALFVSNAYYHARENIIKFMDLAARVYQLWTLDVRNILSDSVLGKSPIDIDYTVLEQIQGEFWREYTEQVIKNGPMGQPFNNIIYEIKDTEIIENLSVDYSLSITVKPQQPDEAGPFSQMSEIRISTLRVFIEGAKTNTDELILSITHGTKDIFLTKDAMEIAFDYQQHYTRPFHYNLKNESEIKTEPDFRVKSSDSNNDAYPVMGPFTSWLIKIIPDQNPGLDLSGVTCIKFVFDGICNGFNS